MPGLKRKRRTAACGPARRLALLALALLLASPAAALVPERRRDYEDRRPNEYLVVPAVASLPGVGVFAGVLASTSNVADTGIDAAATAAESIDDTDIGIRAVALRDVPLGVPGLTLGYQYADIRLGNFRTYLPGRDSPDFTIPVTARFYYQQVQPALRLWERRFNLTYQLGYLEGYELDEEGNEYRTASHSAGTGLLLDLTDDVVDPYRGVRFRYNRSLDAPSRTIFGETDVPADAELASDRGGIVTDRFGLTGYAELIESRLIGVWDAEYFQARGREGSDDVVTGGSLPLRGYPEGRWSDRYGVFTGLELRYNLPAHRELDVVLARGRLVAHQFAAFYEVGQVSPTNDSTLYEDMRHSYGAGYRVLLEAIVLRLDLATSEEGLQPHLTAGHHF